MSFSITPVRQPRGSVLCGPACVSMVLSRYGVRRSAQRIARDLPMTRRGVFNAPMGTYFLEQGFDVTLFIWIRGMRPELMGTTAYNAVSRGLYAPLTSLATLEDEDTWPKVVRGIRRFMEAGGDVRLEPVQARHLEVVLDAEWPPIVNINPRILDRYGESDTGHYVVPVSLTGPVARTQIGFYDPISGRLQHRPTDAFMHACHLWHGSALLIRPRGTQLNFDA